MSGGAGRGVGGATVIRKSRAVLLMVAGCAMALAGCTTYGKPNLAAAQPRGASVAFESIDGPPPAQFRTLVRNLNDEAQTRRLAVISRENPSAYRVRGYLAAKVANGQTTISWVWDVFDRDERRALRINGEETAKNIAKRTAVNQQRDAWAIADNAMLQRIARTSMDRLAAFLTSPAVAPEMPVAFVGFRDLSSPEAAGIFRIFKPNADPVPSAAADASAADDEIAGPVPLPRRRPGTASAEMPGDTVMVVAANR